MIAVDTNILVYAHRKDMPFHARAFAALRDLAATQKPWAIPWPCLHEFGAIVTNPRVFASPSTVEQTVDQIDAWLEAPSLSLLSEGDGAWGHLREQWLASQVCGGKVHDARIAALCWAHGVAELWTADRDFSRFGRLRTSNPTLSSPPTGNA